VPPARQSASVPDCSRELEEELSPPSPTQKAEAVVLAVELLQLAAG
jgi:hypothetical protein